MQDVTLQIPSSAGLDVSSSIRDDTDRQIAATEKPLTLGADDNELNEQDWIGDFDALLDSEGPRATSEKTTTGQAQDPGGEPAPGSRGRSPSRHPSEQPVKIKSALASNRKLRQRKKALRKQEKVFSADALVSFDDDDMDGQNAASKKDKLDVMNKVIENRHVHEGWMRGAIEMVSF